MQIEFLSSQKLEAHLARLLEMEGFGESYEEIVRNLVWAQVNRLIEIGRLQSDTAKPPA